MQIFPAVDCEWGQWSPWDACTKTCGGGVKKRERVIKVKAYHGGEPCVGETKDTEECQTQQCPIRKL